MAMYRIENMEALTFNMAFRGPKLNKSLAAYHSHFLIIEGDATLADTRDYGIPGKDRNYGKNLLDSSIIYNYNFRCNCIAGIAST